jgi:hypothetical protein
MSGVRWTETFDGWMSRNLTDFNEILLKDHTNPVHASLSLEIKDLDACLTNLPHTASITSGWVHCADQVGRLTVTGGKFELFVPAGDLLHLRMRYRVTLADPDQDAGSLTLFGFKLIEHDPGYDSWSDATTLFFRLYEGDLTEVESDSVLAASGVLRISARAFLRESWTFRGTTGSVPEQAKQVARYWGFFLSRLARVYVGTPSRRNRPAFPVDQPPPRWEVPDRCQREHDVPGKPHLSREIIPFAVKELDVPLNLHHLRLKDPKRDHPSLGPVLLIHGSGVRAEMFYGQPVGESIAERLLKLGYDVWVESWRASIDLPPTSYTLDQAARIDHPAAARKVIEKSKHDTLRVVCHCQGSVSFLMSIVAGFMDKIDVANVVSSAVSLYVDVTLATSWKQRTTLPAARRLIPYADAQWGIRSYTPSSYGFAGIGKRLERPCGNPACQLANYMYGSGWDTLVRHQAENGVPWLDDDVHAWTSRELGYTPLSLIDQIAESSRYGHIVPATADSLTPADYLAPGLSESASNIRYTFMAGDHNKMFRWQGQRDSNGFMRKTYKAKSQFVALPGFGHLDTFWALRSPKVVWPVIEHGLKWDGRDGTSYSSPALDENLPPREGSFWFGRGRP